MMNLVILDKKRLSEVAYLGQTLDSGLLHEEKKPLVKSVRDNYKTWIFTETPMEPESLAEKLKGEEVLAFVDLDDDEDYVDGYGNYVKAVIEDLKKNGVQIIDMTVIPSCAWKCVTFHGEEKTGWELNMTALTKAVSIKKESEEIYLGRFPKIGMGYMGIEAESSDVPDIFHGIKIIYELEIKSRSMKGMKRMLLQYLLSDTIVCKCKMQIDAGMEFSLNDKRHVNVLMELISGSSGIQSQIMKETPGFFSVEFAISGQLHYHSTILNPKMMISYEKESRRYFVNAKGIAKVPIFLDAKRMAEYKGALEEAFVPYYSMWKTDGHTAFCFTYSFDRTFDNLRRSHVTEKDKEGIMRAYDMIQYAHSLFVDDDRLGMLEVISSELMYLNKCLSMLRLSNV